MTTKRWNYSVDGAIPVGATLVCDSCGEDVYTCKKPVDGTTAIRHDVHNEHFGPAQYGVDKVYPQDRVGICPICNQPMIEGLFDQSGLPYTVRLPEKTP